jgi:hypothetical protein
METERLPEESPHRKVAGTKDQADHGAGYERRDASIPGLLQFGFWLAVIIVVVLFAMKWTFLYFARTQELGPPRSPLATENARILPPNPRLQAHPRADLENYCQAEQHEINSYGWVDQQDGIARIPVDRAMDLVLKRGLPARTPSAASREASSPVPAAKEAVPQADGVGGPCGYLTESPAGEAEE